MLVLRFSGEKIGVSVNMSVRLYADLVIAFVTD
jgi:hypothetical protein